MGKNPLRHGTQVARSMVAAALMVPLLLGHAALADTSTQFSPVPQSLLLKFLTDKETFTLVDARSATEFDESHVGGAINVPHDAPDEALMALPPDAGAPIVVYCKTGKRAARLQARLLERGYTDVRVMLPGQIVWFDGMAVFNCGTPAAAQPENTFTKLITEVKGEGEP